MNIKCPCCGSQFSLEVALQEDAGRELLAEIARLSAPMSRALIAYLGLFRPAERVLSWSRALKLAREVLALGPEYLLLPAMESTLTTLQDKRVQPGWQAMKNHNYLKRVLESVEANQVVALTNNTVASQEPSVVTSTRKRSLKEDLTDTSWAG